MVPFCIVGGGEDSTDGSGVFERRDEPKGCREVCTCDDGGGVMEDERSDDVPGATNMDVLGEAVRWVSCREGTSRSTFCGVDGISTGVDPSSKELWELVMVKVLFGEGEGKAQLVGNISSQ